MAGLTPSGQGPDVWGSGPRLQDYLHERLQRAQKELAKVDPDVILTENVHVITAELLGRHMPHPLSVDWDGPTMAPAKEITTQVGDSFHADRTYTVPASKIVVSFPISGTTEMLSYQTQTSMMRQMYGKVSGSSVVVEVVARTLDANAIRAEVARVKEDVGKRVEWVNTELAAFVEEAERSIRAAIESRRERILNDRQVQEALGIPVRTSGASPPPVPARRKQVTLQKRREQAQFVPEWILGEAIYQDVLNAVRNWATSLERAPGTAAKLDEEELRDLLLGTLNGYWEGSAGGELFNGSGKTDILVRHEGRNAFIAECKIWRGPKGVASALDQLLSYLVWRDSKSALIMFIKTAEPAATIEKLNAAVEEHPSYILTKDADNPGQRMDYVVTADDEGRRVSLAVIPVVIRVTDA
jgi:hypothetical protein